MKADECAVSFSDFTLFAAGPAMRAVAERLAAGKGAATQRIFKEINAHLADKGLT